MQRRCLPIQKGWIRDVSFCTRTQVPSIQFCPPTDIAVAVEGQEFAKSKFDPLVSHPPLFTLLPPPLLVHRNCLQDPPSSAYLVASFAFLSIVSWALARVPFKTEEDEETYIYTFQARAAEVSKVQSKPHQLRWLERKSLRLALKRLGNEFLAFWSSLISLPTYSYYCTLRTKCGLNLET